MSYIKLLILRAFTLVCNLICYICSKLATVFMLLRFRKVFFKEHQSEELHLDLRVTLYIFFSEKFSEPVTKKRASSFLYKTLR